MDRTTKKWPGAAEELQNSIGKTITLWNDETRYDLQVKSAHAKPYGLRFELTNIGTTVVIETNPGSEDVTIIYHTRGGTTP